MRAHLPTPLPLFRPNDLNEYTRKIVCGENRDKFGNAITLAAGRSPQATALLAARRQIATEFAGQAKFGDKPADMHSSRQRCALAIRFFRSSRTDV